MKRILIDANSEHDQRIAVVENDCIEQFIVEYKDKKPIRGNIYLAKVVHVEPALQAAFLDYGSGKNGFLPFSGIHSNYYQIPVADQQSDSDQEECDTVRRKRNYKIQDVIKKRQVMLVQVVKEEKGNKGAALTTYLALIGRYCIFAPNNDHASGISRRIDDQKIRKKLKKILTDLDVSNSMSLIIRTAGNKCSKSEIKKDYEYLKSLWNSIRELTLESNAPKLVHEDGNLISHVVRDIYDSSIDEIIVDGKDVYSHVKDLMKKIITVKQARCIKLHKKSLQLFSYYNLELKINRLYGSMIPLSSGGHIVMHQTEALVAIDVNSGKSRKERHIDKTAVLTNLEAVHEIANQILLRNLSGLIVIDFIDMYDQKDNEEIEKAFIEVTKKDKARMQISKISSLGLLEVSRQRSTPSLIESNFHTCEHCSGTGYVQFDSIFLINLLRVLDFILTKINSEKSIDVVNIDLNSKVIIDIFNSAKNKLVALELRLEVKINFIENNEISFFDYRVVCLDNDNNLIKQFDSKNIYELHFNGEEKNNKKHTEKLGKNNKTADKKNAVVKNNDLNQDSLGKSETKAEESSDQKSGYKKSTKKNNRHKNHKGQNASKAKVDKKTSYAKSKAEKNDYNVIDYSEAISKK